MPTEPESDNLHYDGKFRVAILIKYDTCHKSNVKCLIRLILHPDMLRSMFAVNLVDVCDAGFTAKTYCRDTEDSSV